MAIGKLYIGRKVRDIREKTKHTQAQFAEKIGISTSYLNQIENNQRPVSATVLLSLAENFQIDIASFSSSEEDRLLSALNEIMIDPVFAKNAPTAQELRLIVQNAPTFAHALLSTHQAYQMASQQLASTDGQLKSMGFFELSPFEEVRDFFHFADNYIDPLDQAAEALAAKIGIGESDNHSALAEYLETHHNIWLSWEAHDDDIIRSFNEETRILKLNAYASFPKNNFQMAIQLAQLEASDICNKVLEKANFKSIEAIEICRTSLYNYFAGALLMPYTPFLRTAQQLRHDIELLSSRFNVSLEQVCHRLSTLQRQGLKGIPVFFARVDRAGNITKRHSAAKLQFARFGSACPVWNVHQAFETSGKIIRQLAETPDGMRYLCLAMHVIKGDGGFKKTHPHYALAFGCNIADASQFVYADDMDLSDRASFEPIGISCRICPRMKCVNRAFPPLKHKILVDHSERGVLPYALEEDYN